MIRGRGGVATAAVAIVLATAPSIAAAAARKPILSARIHGNAVTATGTRLQAFYIGGAVFEIAARTKSTRRNRAVAFSCVAFGLLPTTSPVTLTQCNGNYQETNVGRHASAKVWSASTGLQVTVDSFDGTRARGTFTGEFEFAGDGGAPAVVRNGRFDVVVQTR